MNKRVISYFKVDGDKMIQCTSCEDNADFFKTLGFSLTAAEAQAKAKTKKSGAKKATIKAKADES